MEYLRIEIVETPEQENGQLGRRNRMEIGNFLADCKISGMPDARQDGKRILANGLGQSIMVVNIQTDIAPAAPDDGHHIELQREIPDRLQGIHQAFLGHLALKQSRKQMRIETVSLRIVLQNLHEIGIAFAGFSRNDSNPGRHFGKRKIPVAIPKTFFLETLHAKRPLPLQAP